MDKKIEAAIRETLVIGNPVSIKRCVDKLKLIFEQEQALRQPPVSGSVLAIKEEIEKLKKRREMAVFQRKITTQLLTAIEYDNEIGAIDRRLEQLQYKLKAEQRSSLNAL